MRPTPSDMYRPCMAINHTTSNPRDLFPLLIQINSDAIYNILLMRAGLSVYVILAATLFCTTFKCY